MAQGLLLKIDDGYLTKLKNADEAIEKLAKTSEDTKNRVNAAFQSMGTDGVSAFIRALQQAKQEMSNLGSGNVNVSIFNNINGQATTSIDSVNRLTEAIEKLSQANQERLIKNKDTQDMHEILKARQEEQLEYKKASNELKRLNNEQKEVTRELTDENKRLAASHRVASQEIRTDADRRIAALRNESSSLRANSAAYKNYERAMLMSEQTIGSRTKKIERLKNVLSELETHGNKYASEIDLIKKKMAALNKENDNVASSTERIRKSHNRLLSTSDQLARKLALVFSVSAIQSYVNKLVSVRGEFELQQRSLQSILQNKDEADKLWDRTVQLAVRSPFRLGELVSYTKQLAAYRIETEKLYDTNKMLADISAGLGVDMQRLILAFGQVKAANYLRGTELRQFTEANINILSELSKYFTELEGRVVSVGEVFEMVSKRMVSFADVEEVFKRITSAGGIFYNMQEVQSETLKGQISNLRDNLDIMLNDIGRSNDSLLKGIVSLFRNILENWREISDVVIPIINTFMLRWIAMQVVISKNGNGILGFIGVLRTQLGAVLIQMSRGTALAKRFAAINGTSLFAGWATAIAAVVAALSILYNKLQETRRIAKELSTIEITGSFNANKLFADYKRLSDTINDATASYDKQKEALDTLKRTYSDILPKHLLEAENIKKISDGYIEAKNAIYEYVAAKTREKKISFISKEFGEDVEDAMEGLVSKIEGNLNRIFDTKVPKTYITKIVSELRNEVESGKTDIKQIGDRLRELISQEFGIDASNMKFFTRGGDIGGGTDFLLKFYESIKKYKQAVDEVTNAPISFGGFLYEDFNKVKESYEKTKEIVTKNINILKDYYSGVKGIGDIQFNNASDSLSKEFSKLGLEIPKWGDIVNEPFKLKDTIIKYNIALWNGMIKEINSMEIDQNKVGARANFIENINSEIEKFKGNKLQAEIDRVIKNLSEDMGITTEGLDKLFASSSESISEYAKKAKGVLESLKSSIKEYENDIKEGVNFSPFDPKKIEVMRSQIPLVEELVRILNIYLTKEKTEKKDKTSIFAERLRIINELNKEYQELNKTFDKTISKEKVLEGYSKTVAQAFKGTDIKIDDIDFTSPEGLVKSLEKLEPMAKTFGEKAMLALQKAVSANKVKIDVDAKLKSDENLIEQIEDMFSGYELSLELQKLNIPPDLAKQLFNVDTLTLPELKNQVLELEPKFVGTDMEKEYRDFLKKIDDMEEKAQVERLKKYTKYLVKAQSERVKIKLEEMRQLKEIENLPYTDDQKETIKSSIQDETKKKLQQQDWKDFQDSDLYVQMFGEIEYASDKALTSMRDKLLEMRTSLNKLDPSELKEIQDRLNKINEEIIARNPFSELSVNLNKGIKAFKDLEKQQDIFNKAQDRQNEAQDTVDGLQLQLENLKTINSEISKKKSSTQEEKDIAQYNVSLTEEKLKLAINELAKRKQITEEEAKELFIKQQELSVMSKNINEVGSIGNQAIASLGEFTSMLSNFGIDFGDKFEEVLGGIGQMFGGLEKLDLTKPMSVISSAVSVVSGFGNTIASIFGFGNKDKSYEKKIQREMKLVEDLQHTYDKLGKSIEEAYSVDTLKSANANAQKNLEAQIASTQRMIQAEEDKKKTDHERIKEWERDIEEMREKLQELEEERIGALGGFGSKSAYKEAADEFATAWFDAFKETGDGLEGLEDSFEGFMDNIVKKQLLVRGTERLLEPLLKMIDNAIDDAVLTKDELADINDTFNNNVKEQLDALYQSIVGDLGLSGGKRGELSGLQEGIQGVTEQTAQIIEAYLNSMRFFVADTNAKLNNFINSFTNAEIQNPIISHLKVVAEQTTAIHTLLDSLTAPHPTLSGRGLKVII